MHSFVRSMMPIRPSLRSFSAMAGTLILAGVSFGQSTPPAAAAAPPAPPAVTYTGTLDVYYGYNFNKPQIQGGVGTTGPGQRNFDYKDNLMSLGLAEITINKATTDTSRFGFTIKLAYGPTADLLTAPGDKDNKNILQAFGTYLVPSGGKDITINAGKMVTEMGYEVIEPGLNANYSRGILFQDFIPYYHSGVSAAYPLTPTVTGNLYVYNGWNNVSYDTNPNKAIGVGIGYAPNANTSLIFNGLSSREPAGLLDEPKTVLELIGTQNFGPSVSGALDFNYDFGKGTLATAPAVPDSKWSAFGIAGYLKYAMKSGSYLALRGEYAKDKDGFILGVKDAHASEVTLTYSLQNALFPNSELRFELRHDESNLAAFEANDGTMSKKKQDTITISHIAKF